MLILKQTYLVLSDLDGLARDVVGLTEGDTLAHKVVSKISGKHVCGEALLHAVLVNLKGGEDTSGDGKASHHSVNGVKEGLLVLLQVLVVCGWETLESHKHRGKVANVATRLSAEEFACIRVLLLRHERRSGRVRIRHANVLKLVGAVNDAVLCKLAYMDAGETSPKEELYDKIAVRSGVERVPRRALGEANVFRELSAVLRAKVCVAGEGARSEGHDIDALGKVLETLGITLPHVAVRHEPLAPTNGLGRLKVGVSREDDVHFSFGTVGSSAHELHKLRLEVLDLGLEPETHVSGNLIVTGATSVELAGNLGADELGQAALVGTVDILVAGLDLKNAALPFLVDELETLLHLGALSLREESCANKSARVAHGAVEILLPHALVKANRCVELFHQGVHSSCEATSPKLGALVILARAAQVASHKALAHKEVQAAAVDFAQRNLAACETAQHLVLAPGASKPRASQRCQLCTTMRGHRSSLRFACAAVNNRCLQFTHSLPPSQYFKYFTLHYIRLYYITLHYFTLSTLLKHFALHYFALHYFASHLLCFAVRSFHIRNALFRFADHFLRMNE